MRMDAAHVDVGTGLGWNAVEWKGGKTIWDRF